MNEDDRWMGSVAAQDRYQPVGDDPWLPDVGQPLISAGSQRISEGVPWANRLTERLPSAVMGGLAQQVQTPGALMAPNPYPEGSEEALWYEGQRQRTATDWAPGMALNMMGGGVAGTGAKAGEAALTAGYDPNLWHGVSSIKLPKPIAEMSSVLRPVSPVPEVVIGPARLQNSMLMPLLGDRSAAAAELARVNGFPFENPVSLEGGHGYMANTPEMAWAAGKSIAPGIARVAREGAESGLPVHGVYTAMGERSVDFSHMVSDTLAEMAKHTKITAEGEKIFNDTMRKMAPDFPGVLSPNAAEYLRAAPGELRNVFAKTMDTSKMQKYGFPSVAEARVAVTEPRLLNEPTGAAGLSIARMDPKGTLGPSGHSTYDTGIAGSYVGGLPTSVPKEIMFPDIVSPLSAHADAVAAARVAEGKSLFRPTEDYLMGRIPKSLPKLQKADQQWVDSVSQHLTDRGFTLGSGATDKKLGAALLATDQPGIRAYHGSPYDFDRFDLSKIGSGEGAQAYGHGLYFAEKEATAKRYRDDLAGWRTSKLLEGADPKTLPRGGRMYEVNINADPAQMLDWDKRIASPDAMEALAAKFDATSPTTRKMLEDWSYSNQRRGMPLPAGQDIVQALGGIEGTKAKQLSRTLNEAGIPGIKYLDQGSRGAGQGSSNYVVFNDKLIDILRKYGLAGAAPAGMGALAAQDQYYNP